MSKKRANALIEFGADNVLEFASLRIRLSIRNGKSICKKTLRQPPPPNDISSASLAAFGQFHLRLAHVYEADDS